MNDYESLQLALDEKGLKAGLQFLNSRVPHRFTGIYRLDGMVLRSVELIAKDDAAVLPELAEVGLESSFCQYVLRDGHFITAESGADRRLDGHPYQGVLGSYVGLPLQGGGGLFGTLCHFDFDNLPVSDAEFAFLQKVARLLPRYLRTSGALP